MKKIVGTVLCVLPSGKSSTISTLLSAMRLAYRMLSPFSSSTENRPLCIFLDTTHFLQFFPFQDAIIHSVMNSQEYPVNIQPFRAELLEQEGIVFVFNGMIPDFDYGVVYYMFIPDDEKQTELKYQTEPKQVYEQQTVYGSQQPDAANDDSILGTILLAAVLGLALLSPIPGDEILAAAALAGAL